MGIFCGLIGEGKKNDHMTHNANLDYLIYVYNLWRQLEGLSPYKYIILWTDNCPTQYKCRFFFYQIATHSQRFTNSTLIHKFAQKYNFKGSWDALMTVIRGMIRKA